jgi:hypothetical protein
MDIESGIGESGWSQIQFNANTVPEGTYFIRLEAGGYSLVNKVNVIR